MLYVVHVTDTSDIVGILEGPEDSGGKIWLDEQLKVWMESLIGGKKPEYINTDDIKTVQKEIVDDSGNKCKTWVQVPSEKEITDNQEKCKEWQLRKQKLIADGKLTMDMFFSWLQNNNDDWVLHDSVPWNIEM